MACCYLVAVGMHPEGEACLLCDRDRKTPKGYRLAEKITLKDLNLPNWLRPLCGVSRLDEGAASILAFVGFVLP
jgi:hypothetical protein